MTSQPEERLKRSPIKRATKWLVSGPPFVFLLLFFVAPASSW